MGKLAFGLWDSFGVYEMSRSTVAADIYEQHIREVQLAESLGYRSYFIIEHQNSHVGQKQVVKSLKLFGEGVIPAFT